MTVFVDNARIQYGRLIMCHMVADEERELHDLAEKIGIERRWFHRGHYNIGVGKRSLALQLGAKECTTREAALLRRKIENSGTYIGPKHGWTCFHCGETFFFVEAARDHFGGTPDRDPGCLIRANRGLLSALREAEAEVQKLREENERLDHEAGAAAMMQADLAQYFGGARTAHQAFLVLDAMEGRALAAEEALDWITEGVC